jgi:phycocyanobilin:ferredoxin oxidoreductase
MPASGSSKNCTMNLHEMMAASAVRFRAMLAEDAAPVPVEDYGWANHVWSGRFARGHVELLTGPLAVLHVTVFPWTDDPAPIYGFDIIAGPEKASGAFLDLTPTIEDWGPLTAVPAFRSVRPPPDWGGFSPHFLAIHPVDANEVSAVLTLAEDTLADYLSKLGRGNDHPQIGEAQRAYCRMQRSNHKTMQVLARMLGEEHARRFMDEVLFPYPGS